MNFRTSGDHKLMQKHTHTHSELSTSSETHLSERIADDIIIHQNFHEIFSPTEINLNFMHTHTHPFYAIKSVVL